MRKWLWFAIFICIALLFVACDQVKPGEKINWSVLLGYAEKVMLVILGVYELLARLFPSVKDWTILGNIIKVLKWISDKMNNTKKEVIV